MRALTVQPGTADSLHIERFRVPGPDRGAVLVRALLLGVCGTDRELIAGLYGTAPADSLDVLPGLRDDARRLDEHPELAERLATRTTNCGSMRYHSQPKPSADLIPCSVYWPLRHISHSPAAQFSHGTGSG